MPYGEVQDYASVYGLQTFVIEKLQQVQFREAESLAPLMAQTDDFKSMSPDDFKTMLTAEATNYLDLQTIASYMKAMDNEYQLQMKKRS